MNSGGLDAARIAFRKGQFDVALDQYRRIPDSDRWDALSRARFGSCLLSAGEMDDAMSQFMLGLRDFPHDLNLVTHLACAQEARGQEVEAAKLYRLIISKSAHAGVASVNLGYLMLIRGNPAGAVDCLQRGLEVPPSSIPISLILPTFKESALPNPTPGMIDPVLSTACLLLGLKLQECGRFTDAQACFQRSIRFNPRNGSAYGAATLANKVTADDRPFMNQMLELSKKGGLDMQDRIRLLFALGKGHDDLAEYESAIRFFDEAHCLSESQGTPFNQEAIAAEVDSIVDVYNPDCMVDSSDPGSESETPILIVGMMRSGTSLVEQILSSHPEVSAGDELSFWRDNGFRQIRRGLRPPTPLESQEIAKAYQELLNFIDPDAKRVTDKMPHNFMAVGLIHKVFPNARIICCRRNPIDTCLSIYMTDFRHPIPFVNRREDLVFFYRQFERMAEHWRSVIPTNRWLEVSYEELLQDREAQTRKLIDFCGLDWDDSCLRPEENLRAVKTASVWQVRQKVYATSQERWRRYEPWLGELRSLLG